MSARMNISVPEDLRARMRAYPGARVNWSRVAARSFEALMAQTTVHVISVPDVPSIFAAGRADDALLATISRNRSAIRRVLG